MPVTSATEGSHSTVSSSDVSGARARDAREVHDGDLARRDLLLGRLEGERGAGRRRDAPGSTDALTAAFEAATEAAAAEADDVRGAS